MKINPHYKEQTLRFLRLFLAALVVQVAALDFTHVGRSAIISAVIGAVEVAVRQFARVMPVKDIVTK